MFSVQETPRLKIFLDVYIFTVIFGIIIVVAGVHNGYI
jgi:hypothetical protein